jgi:hypothetical protein
LPDKRLLRRTATLPTWHVQGVRGAVKHAQTGARRPDPRRFPHSATSLRYLSLSSS